MSKTEETVVVKFKRAAQEANKRLRAGKPITMELKLTLAMLWEELSQEEKKRYERLYGRRW